jgi:hypothetical protein
MLSTETEPRKIGSVLVFPHHGSLAYSRLIAWLVDPQGSPLARLFTASLTHHLSIASATLLEQQPLPPATGASRSRAGGDQL